VVALPPGTLLQLMYLGERMKRMPVGHFIEIGPGDGEITQRLLAAGWTGTVYDLSEPTIASLRQRFSTEISAGRLATVVGDYLNPPPSNIHLAPVDLVISCMVMEHLDNAAERKFMEISAARLRPGGRMIGLVPASTRHWGIEDDIAGHFRRYSQSSLLALFRLSGWEPDHIAGLTYPVSNLLLPVSNFLVRRHDAPKLALPMQERTKQSGHRDVPFKTRFPSILKLLLNERIMLPLHWLQKLFRKSDRAMVIYFESTHGSRASPEAQ